jgi:hypothetical protein
MKRYCRKDEQNDYLFSVFVARKLYIHYISDISSFTLVNQETLEQLCAKLGDSRYFCNNNSFDDPSSMRRSRLALAWLFTLERSTSTSIWWAHQLVDGLLNEIGGRHVVNFHSLENFLGPSTLVVFAT